MLGIILAGGNGTRFWPKNRELLAKQLIKIAAIIQDIMERLLSTISIENNYVVTHEIHAYETCRQLQEFGFSPSNLIAKPIAKNTVTALALISLFLKEKHLNMEVQLGDKIDEDDIVRYKDDFGREDSK